MTSDYFGLIIRTYFLTMTNTDRFTLMIEALTELAVEAQSHQTEPAPHLPDLRSVLADLTPLPEEALFLGLADDGLPVLLNLYDPIPGPILIVGDQASGKTSLLRMIARGAEYLHLPENVQSGIITQYPDEWKRFEENQNTVGIYRTQDSSTIELLQSLVTWAHNNKGDGQAILLLMDDLEAITKLGQQAEQNLRWLLLRGPSRRVWPIVTLNSSRAKEMEPWLDFFRTRLFGYIENADEAQQVTRRSQFLTADLFKGSQFAMLEGNNWLKFWSPPIGQ